MRVGLDVVNELVEPGRLAVFISIPDLGAVGGGVIDVRIVGRVVVRHEQSSANDRSMVSSESA